MFAFSNSLILGILCTNIITSNSFQNSQISRIIHNVSYGADSNGRVSDQTEESDHFITAQKSGNLAFQRRTGQHKFKKDSSIFMSIVDKSDQETSKDSVTDEENVDKENEYLEQNNRYIQTLLNNLGTALDKWIVSGSSASRMRAYNIMKQIEREAKSEELIKQGQRLIARAGMPPGKPPPEVKKPEKTSSKSQKLEYNASVKQRTDDVHARKAWETFREGADNVKEVIGKKENEFKRSALSNRIPATMSKSSSASEKAKAFTQQINEGDIDAVAFANDKKALQDTLTEEEKNNSNEMNVNKDDEIKQKINDAITKTTELVAQAGAGSAFEGETLGIGGLDDVLSQVKRRIWVPLAAPPTLLKELGINPVRGLLLYGLPGCGKTLLARMLGNILSPLRPITIVSGPEIMDKFVGSSEANLREVFDNPPALYPQYLTSDEKHDEIYSKAALHVIVLDEFDAIARARGGNGDQGDAGVARDSVVNQLLAKMDGVDGLGVPTLVIGLTNKRSLIDQALLRPGRFEVQIEVPPPKNVEQRVSILNVHMKSMFEAGRVLVSDAPGNTAAARKLERDGCDSIPSYSELMNILAVECDGMSGAAIAGVCRAAASRALERAVNDFAGSSSSEEEESVEGSSIADCLVTQDDFEMAVEDVFNSINAGDYDNDSKINDDTDDVDDVDDPKEEEVENKEDNISQSRPSNEIFDPFRFMS